MISGVLYATFAFFLIIGFLYGLKRGLVKSIIRILGVIVACTLVVFITEPIADALLNLDISSSGLEVGGITVSTINDTIIAYLSKISVVAELISASPTIKAVISAVPKILVNMVLFIIVFYLIKAISYILCAIINKLVLKNQPEDAKKHRLAGAFIGAFQGIIVFLFFLIPIAGNMNLLTEVTKEVNLETALGENTETSVLSVKTLDDYNNNLIIKGANLIGYKALTDTVYDKLTVIKINDTTETNLRDEVIILTKVYGDYEKLKDIDVTKMTDEDVNNANSLIDNAFSSVIIGNSLTELTTDVAKKWTASDPTAFLTIEKPTLSTEIVGVFDDLLIALRADTKADLQNDLKVIVASLKVCSDYNVTNEMDKEDGIISAVGQEGFIEDFVGTMSTGKVTKNILPSVVKVGITSAYNAIEVEDQEAIVTKSAGDISWQTEKVVLSDLFENISKVYLSSKAEGEILEKIDLVSFGKALNLLKQSELLGSASQDITIALLKSNMMAGVDTSTLVMNVQNDTTYAELDFEVMLLALKSSANVATDLNNIVSGSADVESLNPEDVGNILDSLTSGDATSDMIGDMASKDNLINSGVDESTADAVSGLVGAIKDYDTTDPNAEAVPKTDEEIQSATGAVEELLTASKNAKDTSVSYVFGSEEEPAKAKMQNFIDNLIASPFIYKVTITKGEDLGFKSGATTKLSADEVTWLKEVLIAYENLSKINSVQKTEIASMFAVIF